MNLLIQRADEHVVEYRWVVGVEANFQGFVVVRFYAETRDETVNHQVDVMENIVLASGKQLDWVE